MSTSVTLVNQFKHSTYNREVLGSIPNVPANKKKRSSMAKSIDLIGGIELKTRTTSTTINTSLQSILPKIILGAVVKEIVFRPKDTPITLNFVGLSCNGVQVTYCEIDNMVKQMEKRMKIGFYDKIIYQGWCGKSGKLIKCRVENFGYPLSPREVLVSKHISMFPNYDSNIDSSTPADIKVDIHRSNFIENKSSMYNVIHYYHKDKTFMFPGKEVLKLTISDIMLLRHLITIKSKLLPETITIPWDEQDGDEGFI